jgi:ATP-dependent RNA helicase DeaD
LLFSATMPKPIVALAKRYQKDSLRIATTGEERGHGDIAYQAVTVAPSDIENAVVNLLRFHEAESALLFCATRENVRRLHSSLTERGFSVVALSGEHSQNERNQALQALRDGRARVLVATDVAARGIDLPNLTLVIHVELPRDAETLQHRSGRTGRAGRKGIAVLIVPYQRRKRVESVLRGARIAAEWTAAPTPEDILRRDRERLLEALLQPVEADEDDRALAQRLLAERSAEDIAAALVRAHRARLPAPEELLDADGPAPRQEGPRAGFEDTVWFRMDIGRRHKADPRWLLPLLCRRGHLTKRDIGAIRIAMDETAFEIPRAAAAKFAAAVKRTAGGDPDGEGGVRFEAMQGPPGPARQAHRPGPPPVRHKAKPWKAKGAR